MQRVKWCLLSLLVLSTVSCHVPEETSGQHQNLSNCLNQVKGQGQIKGLNQVKGQRQINCLNQVNGQGQIKGPNQVKGQRQINCLNQVKGLGQKRIKGQGIRAKDCMEDVSRILKQGNRLSILEAIEDLETALEQTEVNQTTSLTSSHMIAVLHKPNGPFRGLQIHASDDEAKSDEHVTNSRVSVQLPKELDPGSDNMIVFCMVTWPSNETAGASDELYDSRLIGLSVRGKKIWGLKERVNITVNFTQDVNDTQSPRCVFLNASTKEFSSSGCDTVWKRGQSHITCSCDHLTFFGVLMVSASLPPADLEVLSYITLVGCSLSLFTLIIAVLLFITKRTIRADMSMKVHINLAVALILLNVHFLPSQTVAALASSGLCLYMALSLHYSLLATFSWMALESFHLYLLLVRVFNIYIRKYLLKLSLVGWGVPAVIVSLVVLVDRDAYGHVPLDVLNPNSTTICYISNRTVKMVTTVGVFCLVFIFNSIMLGVTAKRIMSLHHSRECERTDQERAKKTMFILLGVTTLLGITWGLIFFSFGYLTVPGLYAFCILNSLQGFFIFLWFMMSLRRKRRSDAQTSSVLVTRSINSSLATR